MADESAYQSLYRRFRPQRFAAVRGQDHITNALRNAVGEGRVAHAYLFSGPRGTGKTTTARILAKALNCEQPTQGEPCDICESCRAVTAGSSLDVQELDAASNNGVDAIRDLISRVALATPGRWKVYIVDEVHMLSTPASNALLKTLEEPPAHVVFVLATTDPQKVLPTIQSRTQRYQFRLMSADVLDELARDVAGQAGIDVDDNTVTVVTRRGAGSARDMLSALDQVAASGGVGTDEADPAVDIVAGLAARDAGETLVAVARALNAGRDARRIGEAVLARLRVGFLSLMAPDLDVDVRDNVIEDHARQLGPAGITRALEVVGDAVTSMKEAVDARVALETALVRVARTDLDVANSALLERIDRLERQMNSGGGGGRADAAPAAPKDSVAPPPAPPAAAKRPSLRVEAPTKSVAPPPAPTAAPVAEAPAAAAAAAPSAPVAISGEVPTRDELTLAWGDTILDSISPRAKARFRGGHWVDAPAPTFALPTDIHKQRCDEVRLEVQEALSQHFGRRLDLTLVVDSAANTQPARSAAPSPEPHDDVIEDVGDVSELEDAGPVASGAARLLEAFPGAVEEPS
ncbi:MAG: DNA polymerase III subunit gamma/tau [Acidimicrobiales bacterium]|nr:DNA polymerase III subunit gamma/tau [Acidimicrobiales bacterium]